MSQQPYQFSGSQFLGSQSQGTPGYGHGQTMTSQPSQLNCSQGTPSQGHMINMMASQSSQLNSSQRSQTQGTPSQCQGHAVASSQLNCSQPRVTPGQGFVGFQLNNSQTQGTPSQGQAMASQPSYFNCSQPRSTPLHGPMASQPLQLNCSQTQGTPSQGQVMQSSQPRSTPGPRQLNGQSTPIEAQQPTMQIQQQPSVIRCQLIPPSQMPRPQVGTPVFATPSLTQYLQSQNATQSRSTPEEEAYEASRMEKNYKTMTDAGCIQLLASSIDSILKDTCNNAFRQEIFQLLEVQTSDDATKVFKEKLTALCAKGVNGGIDPL